MSGTWELPDWLTRMPDKRRLFAEDTYFVEAWQDALETVPDVAGYCARHTYLLVKPEALGTGRLPRIVRWLADMGWQVTATRQLTASRHVLRGLWRYHWNAVTRQHKDVVDLLFGTGPCLFLLLRSATALGAPATEVFSGQKGPAKPERRSAGELRFELGQYNAYLNFVHSPDEPADLLRELAVLFPDEDRRALLATADAGQVPVVQPSYVDHPTWNTLDFHEAARRIGGVLGRRASLVDDAVAARDAGTWTGDWREIRAALDALDPAMTREPDFVVFASYLTSAEVAGRSRQIATVRGPASSVPAS